MAIHSTTLLQMDLGSLMAFLEGVKEDLTKKYEGGKDATDKVIFHSTKPTKRNIWKNSHQQQRIYIHLI
ncbi:unnamed protein product [Lactuca virosa]|uniref:Uncharacterized protein n=1 Tax=Lactuca virosa TaxID=75947 RepID=A0AAU9NWB3_9ASTR|nr:unnamed protein product [Lactuca virosa]